MRRLSFKFVLFIASVFLFSSIVIALTLGGSIGTVISVHSDNNLSNNSSNETNSSVPITNVSLDMNVTANNTNQTGNNTVQNATNMTENGGSSGSGTVNPIYDNQMKPTTYDVRFDNSNHKGDGGANENVQIRGVGFVEVQNRDTRGIRPAG